MSFLQELGTGQGHLKAGFLGFPKSGKTYTAMLLALGVREYFGLKGPIAMFDTEGGSEYIAPTIKAKGAGFVGVRSRSLQDLIGMTREAEAEVSVLIVDSVTHVWREVCDAYLSQVNEQLMKKQRSMRTRLEFQDWAAIKGKWAVWTDLYLNSRLHIIICGRAGFEWEFEEREDELSGKVTKELIKTGVKMKTESEFGFEPSLLVQMERVQERDEANKLTKSFVHRATVIGDRFAVIDGKTADDPGFEFFKPHVDMLVAGAHAHIDTDLKTDHGINEQGDDKWRHETKQRVILCEEIQGELMRSFPGQTKEEKSAKMELIEQAFGTRSWTKVEGMNSDRLRTGLGIIRDAIHATKSEPEGAPV